MGMFDSLPQDLDSASQLLAGGKTTATPAADAATKPPYVRGEDLDTDDDSDAGARAANLENAHNTYPIIEFIHFGYVHHTHTNIFPHGDFQDDKKDDSMPDGARPRAIQFRSALEREAILLATFMECTQTVLDVRDKSGGALGGLGKALNAAGNLLGEGGGGSGKISASDLNGNIQAVVDAAKPILDDTITYTNVHKAGMDLHQARRNYRALLQKIVDEKGPTNSDSTGGMMGTVTGFAGGLGGAASTMANVLTFTQGVAFKPQDILVKFFALVAQQTEAQVEIAANTMTLNAIKALGDTVNTPDADKTNNTNKSFGNPFLPVWMYPEKPQNQTWDDAPDNPLGNSGDSGLLDPLMNPVKKATDQGRQDVIDEGNKVKAFFEHPPDDPPPGTDPLGIAFMDPPLAGGDKNLVPMAMDAVAIQAFVTALGMTPPLGIPEKVIGPVVAVTLEFVAAAYKSILVRDETTVISKDAVLKSGRDDIQIGKRLEDIARSHLTFLDTIRDWQTPDIAGFQTRPGQLIDKGVTDIDSLISDKLKPLMDPVLKYAMDTFADQLELARQNALSTKSNTMEWYLGRLPWMHASLFCNLFLPFWNALMRCASDIVDKGTGGALKAILNAADKVKGGVDFVRSLPNKVDALEQAGETTVGKLGSTDWLDKDSRSKLTDGYGSALNKKADKIDGPKLDQGKFIIPVTGRSEKGTGQDITTGRIQHGFDQPPIRQRRRPGQER